MAQARTEPGELEEACREWEELLGKEAVLRAPDVLARYGRTTLPGAPSPVAVLRPLAVEQVLPIVRVAAEHRVPLYPISRGKSWGWGDACPVTAGQAILDLSALDRILAIDEALGYAVVQPGVTQGQLAERLGATGSAWWLDATAAGPETSVLGNILERGGTRDERSAQVCGMEVVLADGTLVRTGYGHYPGSRVTHVARWGVGPALDGLFSQSNLGIVTALGFWLQPKPAHAELGYYAVPDEALEAAIDALRPFRIRGVVSGQPLQLPPTPDRPVWLGITTLQGHPQAVAAHRAELTAALASVARVAFPRPEEAADPAARAATLARLGLPPNPFFDNILRRADPLAAPRMTPEGLLAWLGGAQVQHPTEPPASTDPLDHDYGFYFAWPTCPALGREVRALLDIVRPILAAHGCPQLLALRFVTGRAVNLVMRIAFDRKREERRVAARARHQAILETTLAAGYPSARMSIDGMERLDPAGDTYWQVVRRLKRCLDPDGILAPVATCRPRPGRDQRGRTLTLWSPFPPARRSTCGWTNRPGDRAVPGLCRHWHAILRRPSSRCGRRGDVSVARPRDRAFKTPAGSPQGEQVYETIAEPNLKVPIKTWLPPEEIEAGAMEQLRNAAQHPHVGPHVAVMPDCHVGFGVTIGCVFPTLAAVVPTAVGVDIACGMCAVPTGKTYTSKRMDGRYWQRWADAVRATVPTGFGVHKRPERWDGFAVELRATELQPLIREKAALQLGTLGGGNHFLEAQVDETDQIWLMVHSGSRHTGLRIANSYTALAKGIAKRRSEIVPPELWTLPLDDETAHDYLHDMDWATEFALESRYRMLEAMLRALGMEPEEVGGREAFINIHHNFARVEEHFGSRLVVHRKGATSARAGEIGIIPGSMGAPSYIVRGRGNEQSFASCSHGAGRRMGRKQARRSLAEADLKAALAGTHTRPSLGFLDEAPQVYKDVMNVLARQQDLVEIVHTLRPLITVKGDSKAKED